MSHGNAFPARQLTKPRGRHPVRTLTHVSAVAATLILAATPVLVASPADAAASFNLT